jgi:hypothetical protein
VRRHQAAGSDLLVLVAALGGAMFQIWIGPAIAAVALLGFGWVHFGRPWWRGRRLRHPCTAHFVIRPLGQRDLPYVLQDTERHDVRQLVLPSYSAYEIDIGIRALVPIKAHSIAFGCDGDNADKPYAIQYLIRYEDGPGQREFSAAVDEGHSMDMHAFYHRKVSKPLNADTHWNMSYKLATRAPGTYKTHLFFFTDEIQGSVDLSIVVEDKPSSRMKCIKHRDCYVRPRLPRKVS